MKKFNNFSILRPGKLFLLTLATWLTMAPSWSQESETTESGYLGFTATEGNTTVRLNKKGSPNNINLQYSKNGGNWTNYTVGNDITLVKGDKVEFKAPDNHPNTTFSQLFGYHKAKASGMFDEDEDYLTGDFYYFSFSNNVEASGNVATLLSSGSISSLPDYAFAGLFQNCTTLLSAPSLPDASVELSKYCYAGMFFQCTKIQSAPELPATTLKDHCYTYMFAGCERLQSINVGFTSWENYTENWVYSTKKSATAFFVRTDNINHPFSATGGIFHKPAELSFESNESRIPKGWTIPSDKDYLFFSWNSKIQETSAFEGLINTVLGWLFGGGSSGNSIYATISLNQNVPYNATLGDINIQLEYSKNGYNWTPWTWSSKSIQLNYGESCYIRSAQSNYKFSTKDRYRYFSIELSDDASDKLSSLDLGCICVTGNVMSLLDKNVLTNEVPEYGFYKLFQNNVNIFNAPTLPATDLNPHCYESMFEGCTKLNAAPNLPATTEQIEEAVAEGCYNNMFKGCSKIDYIKVGFNKWIFDNLNTTNSTFQITSNWVNGVTTSGGTFRCPDGLNLEYSDSRIPTSWRGSSNVGPVDEKKDWLCFELTSNFGTVKLDRSSAELNNLTDKLQYSFTGTEGSWNNYTWADKKGQQIDLNAKEGRHRVYFRSTVTDNSGRCSNSSQSYYQFKFSGIIEASGNVMSLIHKTCQRYDVNNFEFFKLFYNCKTLKSAPILPATKLGENCYQEMFEECRGLITPPELPATELKQACYNWMFGNCTNMSSAPELPATSLAPSCYRRMFEGCTSIENAPILPATDLVNFCYWQMFKGCSSLKYINVNFLEWNDKLNATNDWVNGVNNQGIFFCPQSIATEPEFGTNRIPKLDEDGKRWTVKENSNTALYFEAKRNSSTIRLDKVNPENAIHLIYSTNDGQTWSNYTWNGNTGETITLNKVGNKRVYFKAGIANDDTYVANEGFSTSGSKYYKFVMKGSFNAHGNIMSLLSKDGSQTVVPQGAFIYLFKDCKVMHSAPSLPALTLSKQCYQWMFNKCTSLTVAPELPATEMQESCYSCMFVGCTNLQQAPKLPAMSLSDNCYYRMFEGNTSLTIAPELPATELKKSCYASMFKGCSNLEYVNVGFKQWHSNATTNWFSDSDNGQQTIKSSGIFMCPDELPHDKNAQPSNFGVSRIPKADIDGQRWNVNVVALRFTANNNATIALEKVGTPDNVELEYSIDNAISWHPYSYGEVYSLKPGNHFYIRATGTYNNFSKDADNYYHFSTIGSLSVDGNIMALMDNFARGTYVPNYAFYNLFKDCEGLSNVPELPASTVGDYGYANMFSGCLGFTEVDTLRATTLGKYCYSGMFSKCTGLKTAPALPTESLNDYCYANMFDGCSGLKNAPELPATTLKVGCYKSMFQGCTSLVIAPELPATTLVSECYATMFSGCSFLSEISVEFSAWSPNNATSYWVSGVANEGIFSCPKELPVNSFNANRVPKDNNHKWEVNPDFLGFKAITDATIALNKVGAPHAAYLIYSINNKSKFKEKYTWDGQNGLTIGLHAGESVYFKAENDYNVAETTDENNPVPNKLSKDADNYYQFAITGTVAASGKASFLLSRTKNSEEVPAYGFYRLFKDCTGLTTAPGVAICAKANAHSYESMFEGCSNMTTSPETLPATTLAESCYKNMFKGCEKMATSPDALPATSVVVSCYEGMFEGDSLITRIPTLGVSTTSAVAAYKNMFKGCKSLTSDNMPSTLFNNNSVSESFYEGMFDGCSTIEKAEFALPAGGLAKACYKNMFRGCSSLTKVPTFGTPWNIIESCYEGMFEGCRSLETAPTLSWTTNAATTSFKNMFKGCSALRNNIPSAMSSNLATSCYESMFEGCESMTTTPSLPTSNLAEGCYKAMFKGCTSLVSSALPTLPARVMKTSCYESMFEGCTGVTTPATQYQIPDPWNAYTLAEACFKNMYKGCTSLTSTPNTFNNALYASCFEGMFEGCTSLTKVPSLAQDILAERCYYRMFAGCTSLKQAPELPAKKENLKDSCYAYMFNGCTNLHYMDVAFNEWHYEDLGATHKWVENVSPTGTFMCPDGLAKVYDINHIPVGWSAEDNGDYLCFTALSNEWTDLQFQKQGSPNQLSYKYSRDKKNWTSVAGGTYQQLMGGVSVGTTVYIKITEGRLSKDANNYWKFTCNKPVAVSGNITSLLDASMEQTDVPDYSFYKLFAGCTSIQDISGLKMPATEVGAYAYANMFEGCTYLQNNSTVAPELPATTLGNYCYQNLFKGWKKLQVAPALPAKTLAEGCYSNMFNGCTDLKSVSALPATELQAKCYESMFAGCAKLDSLNVAFTAWSPASATNNWVAGVSDEGNFVCPWALAQDAISKSGNNLDDAYGESMIPKEYYHPWLILLVTDMEFDYKTGTMTIAGRKPITYTTDPSLTVDNRIGTTLNETSTTVDLKDWLNDASITDLDSITYYAIAGESMNGGKIKPTVNKMTIYRYPKKIDMCICDTEAKIKKALYYANKVSSPRYPIKLFLPDNEYIFDETLAIKDSTISIIGESLNGTILKSSAPLGVFDISGDNAYLQDLKMANTGSGAAFTNRSLNTTLNVAMSGYYLDAPGGIEHKSTTLPKAWTRATDPTQATINNVSQNGSTLCITPGENCADKYLIRIDNKYSFAPTREFFILENLNGKNVYVRAANVRGALGEPITPTKMEADGDEYTAVSVKLNGNGFISFSYDDDLFDQVKVIGASAFKGVYHEGAVYLTRLNEYDIIPRRTGVILVGLPNSTLHFYWDNTQVNTDPYADVTGDNIPLVGNYTETIQRTPGDGKYYYGLSGNVFKKLSDKGIIKPNKAYFDLTGKVDANANNLRIIFGMWEEEEEEVVSGINYLPTAGSDSEYSYSLTGVRMKEAKGLVIQNNKVVLIK